MIQKELGRTGILIPELGIGTWNYHAGPLILRKGLDLGALFIDTAESYGTEPVVGDALRGIRDRVFLATKVSPKNFRSNDLRRSADRSLQRLGTDRIDLLQLHEPNPSIPIEETMGAMADLVCVQGSGCRHSWKQLGRAHPRQLRRNGMAIKPGTICFAG